ncbi:Nucleic-acid-binding protein from transposon X-element, partial [Stegodyphus mimosarum]
MVKPEDGATYNNFLKKIAKLTKANFYGKVSGEYLKLLPGIPDDHRLLSQDLLNHKIEHYVITPRHKKPIKVVIRGLPITTEKSEIIEELTKLGYSIFKVVQLTRFRTKQPMPLYQVQLNITENVEKIYDETHLGLFMITVEKYINKNLVPQCHNCQRFHHSSDNCFFQPRCVKCAQFHKTQDCPHVGPIENPVCVNCTKNHPASYRGCEKFPKIKTKENLVKISTNNNL